MVVSREYRRACLCLRYQQFVATRFVCEHATSVATTRFADDLGIERAKEGSRTYPRTRIMYTVSKGPSKIVAKTRRGTDILDFSSTSRGYRGCPRLSAEKKKKNLRLTLNSRESVAFRRDQSETREAGNTARCDEEGRSRGRPRDHPVRDRERTIDVILTPFFERCFSMRFFLFSPRCAAHYAIRHMNLSEKSN